MKKLKKIFIKNHKNLSLQEKSYYGEIFVKELYERKSYGFLRQNFRCLGSEIDLIFKKKQTIVFIEVKLRRKPPPHIFLNFYDLIPNQKKKALMRGADSFLQKMKHLDYDLIRFDFCLLMYQENSNLLEIEAMKRVENFLFDLGT